MEKLIRISTRPNNPSLEVVGDIVLNLFFPYSAEEVTIQINPNITEYKERPTKDISQFKVTKPTDETQTIKFDFKENNIRTITDRGKKYQIKLMNIGKETFEGQAFSYFEFFVKEL